MTVSIQAMIQQVEPEPFPSIPVHRFHDEHPSARHSHGLIQHTLGVLTVMERQQRERRIKNAVSKWKPGTVIDHIGARHATKWSNVRRTHPPPAQIDERSSDITLTGPEIEDARAYNMGHHGRGFAYRIMLQEGLEKRHGSCSPGSHHQ